MGAIVKLVKKMAMKKNFLLFSFIATLVASPAYSVTVSKTYVDSSDKTLQNNMILLRDMLNTKDSNKKWITLDTDAQYAIPAINELHAEMENKQDAINADNQLSAEYVSGLAPVATSGKYADLIDAPEIPSVENFATSEQVAAIQAALADKADASALDNLIDQTALDAVVADLESAIADKQVAGDYVTSNTLLVAKQELEQAIADVEKEMAAGADVTALQDAVGALQETVTLINDAYAKSSDVTAADDALRASINTVVANVASNLEYITANAQAIQEINTELDGLATVAKSGSYNDLADKPTLITQNDLTTLRTALEAEIAKKQDVGEFATAASLKLVSDSLASLKADTYTKAEIDQMIADAVSGGQIDLSGYLTVAVFNDALAGLQVKDTELSDGLVALTESLGGYVKKTDLAAVATSGSYKDLTDTPDLSQYVTNETIQNNYVTNTALEQKNYVTEGALEQKNYLTQELAADTYLTTEVAASTYVTEQQVNNALNAYEIPDGSITAVKLADGAVSAEKINTGTGNAGEMMMLVSNGDGTSSWVSIEIE